MEETIFTEAPGWLTALAAVAAVVLPLWGSHRATRKRLDGIDHQLRNQKRDIRRLERYARRMSRIVFPDVENGRRWYDRHRQGGSS